MQQKKSLIGNVNENENLKKTRRRLNTMMVEMGVMVVLPLFITFLAGCVAGALNGYYKTYQMTYSFGHPVATIRAGLVAMVYGLFWNVARCVWSMLTFKLRGEIKEGDDRQETQTNREKKETRKFRWLMPRNRVNAPRWVVVLICWCILILGSGVATLCSQNLNPFPVGLVLGLFKMGTLSGIFIAGPDSYDKYEYPEEQTLWGYDSWNMFRNLNYDAGVSLVVAIVGLVVQCVGYSVWWMMIERRESLKGVKERASEEGLLRTDKDLMKDSVRHATRSEQADRTVNTVVNIDEGQVADSVPNGKYHSKWLRIVI
jgi:hypothetical protein